MKLSELFLNRQLYRDNNQDLETKDSTFMSADSSEQEAVPVYSGGAAQDINTGNVEIDGGLIIPGTTTLDVSNWGWSQDCAFSSTDLNTVSWGGGTFTSANGDTYTISAGNTGNMSAKTYIYLSLLDSLTVYQTTTISADSVGIGKVLIAVAENAADDATYNLQEANQIVADNILANTIDASKMNVGQLSAITANIGSITAGSLDAVTVTGSTITGSTLQTAASGWNINITGTELEIRNGSTVKGFFSQKSGETWSELSAGEVTTDFLDVNQTISGDNNHIRFINHLVNGFGTLLPLYLGESTNGWARLYLGTSATPGYLDADVSNVYWNGTKLATGNAIPSGGSSQQFLKYQSSGQATWAYLGATANAQTIIPTGSTATLGNATYYWDNIYGGELNLKATSSSPSSAGDISNYASGATDQFRGVPGDGSWVGSFDMTAA